MTETQSTRQDPVDMLRQAMALHEQGSLAAADALYERILDANPEHLRALRLRGILTRQSADYDTSTRLLRELARLVPDDPVPANELALTYLACGELQRAERALRDALRFDPSSRQALANLGAVLQRRGHLDEAAGQYAAYLDLEPDDLEVRCNLVNTLMEAGHGERALDEVGAALLRAPDDPLMLASKGAVLCALERYAAAIETLEKACAAGSGDDMALVNLAFARRRCGDAVGAADALEQAARMNPANARAVADYANVEMQLGRGDSAIRRCADFLTRYPGERLVLSAYIHALADTGQAEQSAAFLGLDELVTIVDVSVNCAAPAGFDDIAGFNRRLAGFIETHPSLVTDPARKATTGGAQTGELNKAEDPVVGTFIELIEAAIQQAVSRWERLGFADHPVMAYAAERRALRIWGTVLEAGGFQLPHTHPLGWISGVYYARIPEGMRRDDPDAGALEFGMPPEHFYVATDPDVRRVEPVEGRLVLFPSYCFHRTLPFPVDGKRISVAFDVVPLSR